MTSSTLGIRRAGPRDAEAVNGILTASFVLDPVFQWMFPGPGTRGQYTRAFFDAITPVFFAGGDVFIDESNSSVALWLPVDPSVPSDDDAVEAQLVAAVGPHAERLEVIGTLIKAAHPHDASHAYLNFIATRPDRQGNGIGGEVLGSRLRQLDSTGSPAYLEATTERAVKLYQRMGFEHRGATIDLPDGPRMYPMWRRPLAA